jgi:hypothetical protein
LGSSAAASEAARSRSKVGLIISSDEPGRSVVAAAPGRTTAIFQHFDT